MKEAGLPRPVDLARASHTTTATVSNWLKDQVKADHVKAEQLFRIADAVKLDPRELLFGPRGRRISEDGPGYAYNAIEKQHWVNSFTLVSEMLQLPDPPIGVDKQAVLTLMAYDLLVEGVSHGRIVRVLDTSL
ncbi:MAG: hypothetical protein GAK31_01813 [Stenotrophomonas maltophilia]|uniref:Uncharacterized protein n=1 Tax=Stenotrophomonas maltophilia TaxID=40324 RepID=A0A7V8FIG9_STEMA|nr:MAG: hypothetical protein GAK31_01813 [Stenotrophomonas maltophilia]